MNLRMLNFSLLVVVLLAGCAGLSGGDGYTTPEILRKVKSSDATHTLSIKDRSTSRWVPIRDIERTEVHSRILTIATERVGGDRSERLVELMKQPGVEPYRPPFFLGATGRYCFWGTMTGYFTVELSTGAISAVATDRKVGSFGQDVAVNDWTLHRTTRVGVFELTPDGAKEIPASAVSPGSRTKTSSGWTITIPEDWRDNADESFTGLSVGNYNSSGGVVVEKLPGDEASLRRLLHDMAANPGPGATVSGSPITRFGQLSGRGRHLTIVGRYSMRKEFILFYPDGPGKGWYIMASFEFMPHQQKSYDEWQATLQSLRFGDHEVR